MGFPKPWRVRGVGAGAYRVYDSRGKSLFYFSGDQGDGVDSEPDILGSGGLEAEMLLTFIIDTLEGPLR